MTREKGHHNSTCPSTVNYMSRYSLSREICNVYKGVVETGEDMCNSEHILSLHNPGSEWYLLLWLLCFPFTRCHLKYKFSSLTRFLIGWKKNFVYFLWTNYLHVKNTSQSPHKNTLHFYNVVYRMEFDKTRWSCPWVGDGGKGVGSGGLEGGVSKGGVVAGKGCHW